jgi:uncharacterized protein YhbP (UPF0306 family)
MPIERSRRRVGAGRIAEAARALLEASTLCAIATVSRRGQPHVNTAYFAWSSELDLYWLSEPGAEHSRNLRVSPGTAVAVYDSSQSWGGADRGIQLFGSASELAGPDAREAERVYSLRFPDFVAGDLGAYRFYRFRPRRLKLFDERVFGGAVFVTAAVRRGGRVSWERTEVYRSS